MTRSNNINILGISVYSRYLRDPHLKEDYLFRQEAYLKHINSINQVIYSYVNEKIENQNLFNKRLNIYFSRSRNKIFFLFDAYRICNELIINGHISVISASDPYLSSIVRLIFS